MWVSQQHIGPLILKEIYMHVLTRAELLFTLCYEIPCKQISQIVPIIYFLLIFQVRGNQTSVLTFYS